MQRRKSKEVMNCDLNAIDAILSGPPATPLDGPATFAGQAARAASERPARRRRAMSAEAVEINQFIAAKIEAKLASTPERLRAEEANSGASTDRPKEDPMQRAITATGAQARGHARAAANVAGGIFLNVAVVAQVLQVFCGFLGGVGIFRREDAELEGGLRHADFVGAPLELHHYAFASLSKPGDPVGAHGTHAPPP